MGGRLANKPYQHGGGVVNGSSWGTGILLSPGMVLTCSHILSRHPSTRNGTSLVTVLDSVSVIYISGRHVYKLYAAILKEALGINSLKFILVWGGGGGGGVVLLHTCTCITSLTTSCMSMRYMYIYSASHKESEE